MTDAGLPSTLHSPLAAGRAEGVSDGDFHLVEISRRLANVVRPGVVAALDPDKARLRAHYDQGDPRPLSAWLPWLSAAAGGQRAWRAPALGEQVLILAPGGDLQQGVVLASLYGADFAAPSADPAAAVTLYADGARIEYHAGEHRLRAALPPGATAEITASGGVSIAGDVTITGDVAVSGGIAASGHVADAAGSMAEMRGQYNRHKHKLTPPDPPPAPQMT